MSGSAYGSRAYGGGARTLTTLDYSTTYGFNGAVQTYTVPAGVYELDVDAWGAEGGGAGGPSGKGGRVQARIPVTPGEVLELRIGGQGVSNGAVTAATGGFNGGGNSAGGQAGLYGPGSGGGGATDIRRGGSALTNRILVAGGGGGGADGDHLGGPGGGLTGLSGIGTRQGGSGGTQHEGGFSNGTLGLGGVGVDTGKGSGGGGGGYYGGGGGANTGGGGGGSSYTLSSAQNVIHSRGVRTGSGSLKITPVPAAAVRFGQTAPTGLTASTGQAGQVTLDWSDLAVPGAGEGYELLADGVPIYTGTATEFVHTGLAGGEVNEYTVRSYRDVPVAPTSADGWTSGGLLGDGTRVSVQDPTIAKGAGAGTVIKVDFAPGGASSRTLSSTIYYRNNSTGAVTGAANNSGLSSNRYTKTDTYTVSSGFTFEYLTVYQNATNDGATYYPPGHPSRAATPTTRVASSLSAPATGTSGATFVPFFDDFNRSDRVLAGDNGWAEWNNSSASIVNNRTSSNTGSGASNHRAVGPQRKYRVGMDYATAGALFQVWCVTNGGTGLNYVWLRFQTNGNLDFATVEGNTTFTGGPVTLVSDGSIPATGYVEVDVEIKATTVAVQAFVNGVARSGVVEMAKPSGIDTNPHTGFFALNSGSIDNFRVGEFGVAQYTPPTSVPGERATMLVAAPAGTVTAKKLTAPTFVSARNGWSGVDSAGPHTVLLPTGLAVGDRMFATLATFYGRSLVASGWTRVVRVDDTGGSPFSAVMDVFTRVATQADVDAGSTPMSISAGSTTDGARIDVIAYRGVQGIENFTTKLARANPQVVGGNVVTTTGVFLAILAGEGSEFSSADPALTLRFYGRNYPWVAYLDKVQSTTGTIPEYPFSTTSGTSFGSVGAMLSGTSVTQSEPESPPTVIAGERATTSVAAPAGDVTPHTLVEGLPSTIYMTATPGVVAAVDNSYPGYEEGYTPGGQSPDTSVVGSPAALTLTAPAGSLTNSVNAAGPRALITATAPVGAPSGSAVVAGPLASETFIWTAHPGGVNATSNVPIDALIEGPLATSVLAAPRGTLATSTGTGGMMPRGVEAKVLLAAPAGAVAIGPPTFDPNTSQTGAVDGGVATVLFAAPPGVLVTGPPNLRGPVAASTVRAPVGAVSAYVVDRTKLVLNLALLTTDVPVQPGTLRASVSNGDAGGTVFFFLNSSATSFVSTVLDSSGGAVVDLPINNLAVGGHTVRAGTTSTLPASTSTNTRSFTVTGAPAPAPTPVTPVTPPPLVRNDLVNRWVFQAYDFSSLSNVTTYTLPINPRQVDQSYGDFQIVSEPTVVSSGTVVSWEGAPKPNLWRWSGDVLDKAAYDSMLQIGQTGQRLYLTDHFNRRYLVKIASLSFQRVRDRARPWHHTYEMTAWVLSGQGVAT